jgi:hypothetical protein
MFTMDCEQCPARPRGCDDCIVAVLSCPEPLVDALSGESCGYVLDPEVQSAIEVLLEVGMVSEVEIVAAQRAA